MLLYGGAVISNRKGNKRMENKVERRLKALMMLFQLIVPFVVYMPFLESPLK